MVIDMLSQSTSQCEIITCWKNEKKLYKTRQLSNVMQMDREEERKRKSIVYQLIEMFNRFVCNDGCYCGFVLLLPI